MNQQSTVNFAASMSDQDWNSLGRAIFEGNNGADRRLLFAGNGLLEQIANVSSYAKQLEAKNTEMVLGLRVFKIETPFGELLVKPMGSLFRPEQDRSAPRGQRRAYPRDLLAVPREPAVPPSDRSGLNHKPFIRRAVV